MSIKLENYKIGSIVSKNVYNNLLTLIKNGELDIKILSEKCDNYIIEETKKFLNIKKESLLIAIPTCISLNNCTGYYRYENLSNNDTHNQNNYNFIKEGDVVKVEFGVNIHGCIVTFGETFVYNDKKYDNYLILLNKLEKETLNLLKSNGLNDDIRIKVESMCTEYDCFPLENTVSYQAFPNLLKSKESKCIILNYSSYYDDDDNLAVEPNICYELEENEIYHINITFILDNIENDNKTDHILKEYHDSHLYNYNDYYYSLKLKSSKEFFQNIKNKHKNNIFDISLYKNNPKNRIGVKESYENGILDKHSIYYSKDGLPIFHKKFTAIVTKNGGNKFNE